MQPLTCMSTGLALLSLTLSAVAQQPIIYPAKGQSPQTQNTDAGECQVWAQQATGVDPVALAQHSPNQPGATQPQGDRLQGAARGAAVGAAEGAIAGDAGKGAGIGAAAGTAGGRHTSAPPGRSNHPAAAERTAEHLAATGHLQPGGGDMHDWARIHG
jgi:hypothetical protein